MGLGNPGPEYEDTRHNAGFRLADRLAARWKLAQFRRGDRARETQGTWQGLPVRVLKPQTYMNRSGAAIAPLRTLPASTPANICSSWWTTWPFRSGASACAEPGSAGGHNGLKSIEGVLQRQDYARLRIGVGPAPAGHRRPGGLRAR